MATKRLFEHRQSGPYSQQARIEVSDRGNRLPIDIITGDGYAVGDISMTTVQAELFRDQLSKAIKVAKKAGL